jgi:hypothetical protein
MVQITARVGHGDQPKVRLHDHVIGMRDEVLRYRHQLPLGIRDWHDNQKATQRNRNYLCKLYFPCTVLMFPN